MARYARVDEVDTDGRILGSVWLILHPGGAVTWETPEGPPATPGSPYGELRRPQRPPTAEAESETRRAAKEARPGRVAGNLTRRTR